MLRKILGFLLVALLAGCGTSQKSQKIVVWHWMTDRHQSFEALAQKYKEQTGIEVEFKKFFPPDIYSTKVIAAARAGTLPDIFGILGEKKILASFAKAGHIADLSAALNTDGWKEALYAKALDVTAFSAASSYDAPAGYFAVPIDTMNMQFVYNKDLFRRSGLDENHPPATLDEMIEFAGIIKKKNPDVEGLVCGWGEVWLLHCLATEWAINIMGEEKFTETLKGNVPYTDAQWIEVFELFSRLKNSGILYSDIITMVNREAEDYFARGKAAFTFDGSWSVNVYKQLSPELDYGFFPLPAISPEFPAKIWGGAGASFTVNNKSKNKDKAIDFLKWITAKEQQLYLVEETNNLPSAKGLEEKLNPVLASLLDDLDSATHPNIWPYEEDSRVIEIMDKGLQQIILGEKSPQEVAERIQATKDRVK